MNVLMPQLGETVTEGTVCQVAQASRRHASPPTKSSSTSRPTRSRWRFRRPAPES